MAPNPPTLAGPRMNPGPARPSGRDAEDLVVPADALAHPERHLRAALGALHGTVLDLERLDDLAEIGRVAAEVDRVADLERPAVEADGRDADPGIVVRHDP